MSMENARTDALKASQDFPRGKAIAYCIRMAKLMDRMDKSLAAMEYKQRAFIIMQSSSQRERV